MASAESSQDVWRDRTRQPPSAGSQTPCNRSESRGCPSFSVAEDLWDKGFTVRQLLCFYAVKKIKKSMCTEDVVRNIIIPETAQEKTCYMESAFMQEHGGPQRSTTLVSHALKCPFMNTVLNIMLDASGSSSRELKYKFVQKGQLNAQKALLELEDDALESRYWLCVLAVNEHKALCGDCWTCRDKVLGRQLSPEELRSPQCVHGKKRNPCYCGTPKFEKNDPCREVDKIVQIIGKFAKKVMVSLDPDLETLKRIWIVKEISEAVEAKQIVFKCIAGLSKDVMAKLKRGEAVVPPVADCEVTDEKEKLPVLQKIDASVGGQETFNAFVRCLVEVGFGVFRQLPEVTGAATEAFQRMQHIEVNCTWAQTITSVSELGMGVGWEKFRNLQHLVMNFEGCDQLTDVSSIGQGLQEMKNLQHMYMNFVGCSALIDVSPIGQGLKEMKNLRHLKIEFHDCSQLIDVSSIGQALKEMKDLRQLELYFNGTQLADFSSIGQGLEEMTDLRHLVLFFVNCDQLSDISSIAQGLKNKKNIQHLVMDFPDQLTDVSSVGQCLKEMRNLRHLEMHFTDCSQLIDVSGIGQGLKEMLILQHLDIRFQNCVQLRDVSSIGHGLKAMKNLRELEMYFNGTQLTDVSSIGEGLKKLKDLRHLVMYFVQCDQLLDVSSLGWALEEMKNLQHMAMNFLGCYQLSDVFHFPIICGLAEIEKNLKHKSVVDPHGEERLWKRGW